MYFLTPDSKGPQLINLCKFDYLKVEPYGGQVYALLACTNDGYAAVLKLSANLPELESLQHSIETEPRSEHYAPTTATFQ